MKTISIEAILELPVAERLRLIELIWDSISAAPDTVTVSDEVKAELEARLAEFEAHPDAGYTWDQVLLRLKDGTWRST